MSKLIKRDNDLPPTRYKNSLWAIRWIGKPIGFLLSRNEREEWIGDLKEIRYRMLHVEKYPILFINVVISAKCFCLVFVKIQCLIVEAVSQIIGT